MQSDSQQLSASPASVAPEPSLNARLMSAGVSESYASLLANGHRTPSLALALEIEAKLGIKPGFWSELKAAADAARAAPAPAATAPGCPA